MLLTIALSFIATSALYGGVAGFVFWRLGRHMAEDSYAAAVFSEHVFAAIFGKRKAEKPILFNDSNSNGVRVADKS